MSKFDIPDKAKSHVRNILMSTRQASTWKGRILMEESEKLNPFQELESLEQLGTKHSTIVLSFSKLQTEANQTDVTCNEVANWKTGRELRPVIETCKRHGSNARM